MYFENIKEEYSVVDLVEYMNLLQISQKVYKIFLP